MKKQLFSLLTILAFAISAFSQSDINTKLLFEENSNTEFSSEWQYLSTDIYLLNTSRFERLINDIDNEKKKLFKKSNEIEFLTITTKLQNLMYFGKSEITYPIYNYKVSKDGLAANQSRNSDSREVIRLIDNLPVSSVDDVVEAKIEGKAVTKNKKSELLNVISDQLINISKFRNPTEASFYLVGEMGQYMKSLISNTDYHFSSTIRLFEADDFSQKLHSIKVYALLPPGRNVNLRSEGLSKLVQSEKPEINRMVLEEQIKYGSYPVIVVVNYKSKYQMPVIVGEEVTPELIAQRKPKMKQDFESGLINNEIYRQEKSFTEYLETFAKLNKNLESYSLAMQMGNQLYISQTLFDIVTNYREMLTIRHSRDMEYQGISVWESIFKPEYESILRNADVYMEKDRNMKSCRTIAENLFLMNLNDSLYNDPVRREEFLSAFYAVDLPEDGYLQASVVGKEILAQINIMENKHQKDIFQPQMKSLKKMDMNDESQNYRNQLLSEINKSSCKACKAKVLDEIRRYDERYKETRIDKAILEKDSIVSAAEDILFDLYKKEECLASNLRTLEKEPPVWFRMVDEKHTALKGQLNLLEVVLSATAEVPTNKPEDITDYSAHIKTLVANLITGYNDICQKVNDLCDCKK